jgi:hypothetical protein
MQTENGSEVSRKWVAEYFAVSCSQVHAPFVQTAKTSCIMPRMAPKDFATIASLLVNVWSLLE